MRQFIYTVYTGPDALYNNVYDFDAEAEAMEFARTEAANGKNTRVEKKEIETESDFGFPVELDSEVIWESTNVEIPAEDENLVSDNEFDTEFPESDINTITDSDDTDYDEIARQYEDTIPADWDDVNRFKEAVDNLEEHESEVECKNCFDLFPKEECVKTEKGYLCKKCNQELHSHQGTNLDLIDSDPFDLDYDDPRLPEETEEAEVKEEPVNGNEIRKFEAGIEEKLEESQAQEISDIYKKLSKLYNVDMEELVYGDDGFMKSCYPEGFPDFAGDVIYSQEHWDEFEKWLKETKGIVLDDHGVKDLSKVSIDEHINDRPADIESGQILQGTDNAVVDCDVAKVIAHSEDEKPLDCKMEKPALEEPLAGEKVDIKLNEESLTESEIQELEEDLASLTEDVLEEESPEIFHAKRNMTLNKAYGKSGFKVYIKEPAGEEKPVKVFDKIEDAIRFARDESKDKTKVDQASVEIVERNEVAVVFKHGKDYQNKLKDISKAAAGHLANDARGKKGNDVPDEAAPADTTTEEPKTVEKSPEETEEEEYIKKATKELLAMERGEEEFSLKDFKINKLKNYIKIAKAGGAKFENALADLEAELKTREGSTEEKPIEDASTDTTEAPADEKPGSEAGSEEAKKEELQKQYETIIKIATEKLGYQRNKLIVANRPTKLLKSIWQDIYGTEIPESLDEDLTEAKKDDELPVDPEAAKLEVHTMLNDLVADEIEAINGYEEAKKEILDAPISHKDTILDTVDHIEDEEKEHIDELIDATTEIPFDKEEAPAPVVEEPAPAVEEPLEQDFPEVEENLEEKVDLPAFDSEVKVGDKIRIIHLEGEDNSYDGKEGEVEHIDGIGQLHGTWGGLAVIPGVDDFEIITNEELTEDVKNYAKAEDFLKNPENKWKWLDLEWETERDIFGISIEWDAEKNCFKAYTSVYHASEDNNAEYPERHTDEEEYSADTLEELYKELIEEFGEEFVKAFESELNSKQLTEASSAEKRAFKNGGEDYNDLINGTAIGMIKDPKARAAAVAALKAGRKDLLKAYLGDRHEDAAINLLDKKQTAMANAGMTDECLKEDIEEDEVECGWCHEQCPKSDCRYEKDFGYLCPQCEAELKSRGEQLVFVEPAPIDEALKEDNPKDKDVKDIMNTWGVDTDSKEGEQPVKEPEKTTNQVPDEEASNIMKDW